MKKRIVALLVLATLFLTLFCACGNSSKVISSQKAQKLAIEALGVDTKDITDIHTHIATGDTPGYSFHISIGDKSYGLFVDAVTGEVSPLDNVEH